MGPMFTLPMEWCMSLMRCCCQRISWTTIRVRMMQWTWELWFDWLISDHILFLIMPGTRQYQDVVINFQYNTVHCSTSGFCVRYFPFQLLLHRSSFHFAFVFAFA